MRDQRLKDRNWAPGDETGVAPTWERVNTAILLDIRDELKQLNRALYCPNAQDIPEILRRIAKNTHRPKRKRRD